LAFFAVQKKILAFALKLIIMKLFLCFSFFISALTSFAQNNMNETLKQQLVKDWERAKAYTQEYLNTMPANKYEFRAVDSIRSFSEQMLHLAQANVGLIANGTGMQRIFTGQNLEKSTTAKTKDSVVYYVNTSYDFAINAIKTMDAGKLNEVTKSGPFSEAGFTWIMKAFEHQTHHRGQCTIYIRLLGIRPPNEKLF